MILWARSISRSASSIVLAAARDDLCDDSSAASSSCGDVLVGRGFQHERGDGGVLTCWIRACIWRTMLFNAFSMRPRLVESIVIRPCMLWLLAALAALELG